MRLIVFLLVFWSMASVQAAIDAYEFETPEMEAEYNELIAELRCLVCQNQNLAGSDADLAKDLRRQTYEMLQQGKSRDEIVEFMVTRYGDFVLYRPPFQTSTLLLWLGPFLLLVCVLFVVVRRFRQSEEPQVDAEALAAAREWLENDKPPR